IRRDRMKERETCHRLSVNFLTVPSSPRTIRLMISPQSLNFLEGIAAPIVATNLDGMIIYWNAGAQQIFGFSSQEMMLRSWWKHFPETLREQVMTAFGPPKSGVTFAGTCAMKDK